MNPQQRKRPAARQGARAISLQLNAVATAVVALAAGIGAAHAGPSGAQVSAGSAAVQQQGSKTTITQDSARAVIDWRSFNVGRNEWVDFKQPGASAVTLNRVTGDDPSAILGRLTANGQVYLVNPNGVLFGRDAQVNVAGLVASTANISNANFMAGKLQFDQPGKPGAAVVNEGSITVTEGGLVAFVAPQVANSGVINARLGKVSLAAGDAFVLDLYGDQLVNLVVDRPLLEQLTDAQGLPLAARLDQTGSVLADGGRVQLTAATARRLVDNVINVSGVVRATAVATHDGVISLTGDRNTRVAVSGTLQADGQHGGRIEVTGRDVQLTSTARVDASGASGGGSVALGGDWQGQGPLAHAQTLQVQTGATVAANATAQGNGGTVAIWSDQSTQFAGEVQSRGGVAGGQGGQVEVSSKGQLGFLGQVDLAAPLGRAGSLLLDPLNLTIGEFSSGDSQVAASQIRAFLLSGVNVALSATNDITVNSAIDGRGHVAGGGLNLSAGNGLRVNQNIVLNNGALSLTARDGALATAQGVVLATGSGNANLLGGAGVSLGQVLTTGQVEISSALGDVTLSQTIQGAGAASPVASLTVTADAGAVRLNGALVQGAANITAGKDLLLTGNLKTLAGNIALESKTGAVKATVVREKDGSLLNNPQDGDASIFAGNAESLSSVTVKADKDVELGQVIAQRGLTVTSTQGDVMLLRSLGGATTGYAKNGYELGYQAALKPNVGRVEIRAPKGSVELNGLNLDGNADPSSNEPGLTVVAGELVLSNSKIAVNKGEVWLEGGALGGAHDGVYIGDSIYSRGYDAVASDDRHHKIGYKITIRGTNVGVFDNNNDVAYLPGLYRVPISYDGRDYVLSDFEGYVVNENGVRRVDAEGVPLMVTWPVNPITQDPVPSPALSINKKGSGGYAVLGVAVDRVVGKIEISNNAANYSDDRLVPLDDGFGAPPEIKLVAEGGVFGGVVTSGKSALGRQSLKSFSPELVALSSAATSVSADAISHPNAVESSKGIVLKLLGFESAGDVATEVWGNSLYLQATTNGVGFAVPIGEFDNSIFSVQADTTLDWVPGTFRLSLDTGFISAFGARGDYTYKTLGGQIESCSNCIVEYSFSQKSEVGHSKISQEWDSARLHSIRVMGEAGDAFSVAGISQGRSGADSYLGVTQDGSTNEILVRAVPFWYGERNLQQGDENYGRTLAKSTGAISGPGRANSVKVIGVMKSDGTQDQSISVGNEGVIYSVGGLLKSVGSSSPGWEVDKEGVTRSITRTGADSIMFPPSFTFGGALVTVVQGAGGNIDSGVRLQIFDGVLGTAHGITQGDAVGGSPLNGVISVGGKNDSGTSFSSIGASFGAGFSPAAVSGGLLVLDEASRQTSSTRPGLDQGEEVGAATTSNVVVGQRPAALADLGRSGAGAGAPSNVFARQFHLVTSTDKAICAVSASTRSGTAADVVSCQR